MKRRSFLRSGSLGTAALLSGTAALAAAHAGNGSTNANEYPKNREHVPDYSDRPFQLDYAIHDGMFRNSAGESFLDQIRFAHERGFRSIEDNGMRGRDPNMQEQIGKLLQEKGMRMGVFVAHTIDWNKPTITRPDKSIQEQFLREIRESVDVAKRCGAKWMTVVPGVCQNNINLHFQTAYVVDTLKRASDILAPHGLVMVLEPLNFRDHPNLFLTDVPQAYLICKAVNSPACKILYDMYHAQIQVGNIIPYMDQSWEETEYFQIGDNPGRKEPTTGEMNYRNIFRHIAGKGFKGILGMEHGNFRPGKEGEEALIRAYREVDTF